MFPREGLKTVRQALWASACATEAIISKPKFEKSVEFISTFSRFDSAPRAKRGGPNKLKRMVLTRSDFVSTRVTKIAHFLHLLISQGRNNILKVFKSPKLSTHYVLLTCAIGTLQEVILCPSESPKLPIFCICYYLRLETTFSRSLKA